jgi:acetyltransferase-like isoleucine patch superfamily enzyme
MLRGIYRKIRYFISSLKPEKELKDVSAYKIHPSAMVYNKENVLLAESSLVAEFVIIRAPLAKVEVGDNSQIGPFGVLLAGEHGIKIGDNVMIAPHCVIAAGNHEYRDLSVPMRFAGSFSDGPIIIEDDVWIGANCTICDNVKISKGAIIGANSLINKDVDAYDIVGGVPAKKISSRLKYKQ